MAAAASLAGASLSACGDGASLSGGGSGGAYRLMVIAPLSASASLPTPFGESAVGARAAAQVINKSGGVNGRKVEIIPCDTKGDPNAGIKCARRAISEKVTAVVGAFDFKGDYLAVLERAGIPSLAPFVQAPELTSRIAYPVNGGSVTLLAGQISLMATRGIKRAAFVAAGSAASGAEVEGLWAPVLKNFPGLSVKLITVPSEATDMMPYAAAATKSEGVGVALLAAQMVPFVTALRRSPGESRLLTSDNASLSQEVIGKLGDAADGFQVPSNFLPPETKGVAAVDEFNRAMDAVDPKAKKNDFSMCAYVGVKLFAKAAAGQSDVTGKTVMSALDRASGIDLGLLPPISFQKPATALPGVTRLFNTKVIYTSIENGRYVAKGSDFVDAYTAKPAA